MSDARGPAGGIVIGPKTRLGSAVIGQLPPDRVVLIPRSAEDAAALLRRWPGCQVRAERPVADAAWPRLAVFACAVGPIHPDDPALAHASDAGARDLLMVRDLLGAAANRDIHVVFVSSVLALARPRPERVSYVGWKQLVERELEAAVSTHPHARLSVVYPGRLVERRVGGGPGVWLATRYDRLARVLIATAEQPTGTRRVVGIDARLWLAAKRGRVVFPILGGR